uniref:ABC transmembrane type-1 domain-containing protein n=1 Tax=Brassica campestris TaxID=3711 RepID=A0A3P5YL35_BRACM|nr:unnamed protein product [Brassica rapa]
MENEESDVNISVRVQGGQLSILSKDLKYSPKLSIDSGSNLLTKSSTDSNTPGLIPKDKKLHVPSFKRLMGMNRPEWKHAISGCLSAALYGTVQPINAYVSGSMVSLYFLTNHEEIREKTRIYVLGFVGLALFVFLTNIVQHYSFAYMGESLTKCIREKMLSKILTFEVNWFDENENSSGAPVVVACFYTQSILLKSMSKRAIKAQDESSKLAAEAVSNIRTIIAFSSQERILNLLTCTGVLNYWYGGRLIADGKIAAKAFFEMFMIFVSTGRAIADAGTMTTDLAKGSDAVGSVFAVLDRCTTIEPEDPNGYLPEKIKGLISFVNVDFAYPTRPNAVIFKDFSIEIEEGKSTAIVGPSGSV